MLHQRAHCCAATNLHDVLGEGWNCQTAEARGADLVQSSFLQGRKMAAQTHTVKCQPASFRLFRCYGKPCCRPSCIGCSVTELTMEDHFKSDERGQGMLATLLH